MADNRQGNSIDTPSMGMLHLQHMLLLQHAVGLCALSCAAACGQTPVFEAASVKPAP